jgi:predicted nucleotidyltransferase
MMTTSLDVSNKIDPIKIECLKSLQAEADQLGLEILLVGATARDLFFSGGRKTEDVDIGLVVGAWSTYEKLKQRLIESGAFKPDSKKIHRMLLTGRLKVDIIPFDGIETAESKIIWPDDTGSMNVAGFKDVYSHALTGDLGEGQGIRIASIAGMAILKIIAWHDRHNEFPTKDAEDLALILNNYANAANFDRLYEEFSPFVTAVDGDLELAGARLLGHDMASIMSDQTKKAVRAILAKNTVPGKTDKLIEAIYKYIPGGEYERALQLLQNLQQGIDLE